MRDLSSQFYNLSDAQFEQVAMQLNNDFAVVVNSPNYWRKDDKANVLFLQSARKDYQEYMAKGIRHRYEEDFPQVDYDSGITECKQQLRQLYADNPGLPLAQRLVISFSE